MYVSESTLPCAPEWWENASTALGLGEAHCCIADVIVADWRLPGSECPLLWFTCGCKRVLISSTSLCEMLSFKQPSLHDVLLERDRCRESTIRSNSSQVAASHSSRKSSSVRACSEASPVMRRRPITSPHDLLEDEVPWDIAIGSETHASPSSAKQSWSCCRVVRMSGSNNDAAINGGVLEVAECIRISRMDENLSSVLGESHTSARC